MPWSWGKKSDPAPSPPVAATTEAPLSAGDGGAGPMRFQIEDVYTITGIGCVVTGQLIDGVIRIPMPARLVRASPGAAGPAGSPITIKRAMAHHQELQEVRPGMDVGLNLGGLPREASPLRLRGGFYDVSKGDQLIAP